MDQVLNRLLDSEDDREDSDSLAVEFTKEGWVRNTLRWRLKDPGNLHLYRLWKMLRGSMGGDTLHSIWQIAKEPGSADLLSDLLTISSRERFLKSRREARKDVQTKSNGRGKSSAKRS